jgi:hypothetical protein
MNLFEVYLAPGADKDQLLSPDVLQETGAQVFTQAEASFVGFEGLPESESDDPRIFIACKPSDSKFIHTRLEAAAGVARFRLHDVG